MIWNKKLTLEDEKKIIFLYKNGLSASQILKKIKKFKQTKTIYDVLRRAEITCRSKQDNIIIDHFYFSKIDSPAKAYFLGLLITNGWVYSKRNQIGIALQIEDCYILKLFKKELKSNISLVKVQRKKFKTKNGTIANPKPLRQLLVVSKRIVSDLKSFGVVDRKTEKTFLPLLCSKLMPHLIRGILDGDGCIFERSGDKKTSIRFVGSSHLIAQLNIYLAITLGILTKTIIKIGKIFSIEWTDASSVNKVLKYIYKHKSNLFLRRKYEKAKNCIS